MNALVPNELFYTAILPDLSGIYPGLFACLTKPDIGPVLHHRAQLPGIAREEDRSGIVILGEHRAIAVDEELQQQRIVRLDPARRLVGRLLEADAELVFGLDPGREH